MKTKTGLKMSIKLIKPLVKKKTQITNISKEDGNLTRCFTNVEKDKKRRELPVTAVGVHNATATLDPSLAVSFKTNILLSHDPTIKLLGVYPKEPKT